MTGAEGCIEGDGLAREVERRLERTVFSGPTVEAHLTVRVARGEPLQATVLLTRPDGSVVGTRELTVPGGDCGRLHEALALVIALLADLPAAEVRLPPPAPPAPAPRRVSLLLEGRAELALGVFPSAAVGPGVAVSGSLGALSVGLEGAIWPRSAVSLGPGRSSSLDAQTVGAFTCGSLPVSDRATLGACLHVDAGHASARGQGFADNRSADAYRLDLGALVRGSLRVTGPVWLTVGVGPVLTPNPIRLAIEGPDGERQEPFDGSRLWFRAHVGVGVRFPSKP